MAFLAWLLAQPQSVRDFLHALATTPGMLDAIQAKLRQTSGSDSGTVCPYCEESGLPTSPMNAGCCANGQLKPQPVTFGILGKALLIITQIASISAACYVGAFIGAGVGTFLFPLWPVGGPIAGGIGGCALGVLGDWKAGGIGGTAPGG